MPIGAELRGHAIGGWSEARGNVAMGKRKSNRADLAASPCWVKVTVRFGRGYATGPSHGL